MKRVVKNNNSEIILKNLKYINGNSYNNKKIALILYKEQKGFCAYSEEYFTYNDADDIEHFNPKLKDKPEDDYFNWYLVKHLINKRKLTKWLEPILMPYDIDFEKRLIYNDGAFFHKEGDIETKNLIDLLDLNNLIKIKERKVYIKNRKENIQLRNVTSEKYFQDKIAKEISSIKYLRAIQEEFNIKIWEMIP
jgi:hypothetical protein